MTEQAKKLVAEVEKLMKEWDYTTCGDKQSIIACEISINLSLLREAGFEVIEMEKSSGNRGLLDLKTGLFE